jgi:hypothetical protein
LVVSTFAALSGTTPAKAAPSGPRWPIKGYAPSNSDNVILRWDEQLLSTIRAYPAQTGPTITARAIGILHTATYDAWAYYDATAVDTRQNLRPPPPTPSPRQPAAARTLENKSKAISFAAYRVLLNLFPPTVFSAKPDVPYFPPDALMTSPKPDGLAYNPAPELSTARLRSATRPLMQSSPTAVRAVGTTPTRPAATPTPPATQRTTRGTRCSSPGTGSRCVS